MTNAAPSDCRRLQRHAMGQLATKLSASLVLALAGLAGCASSPTVEIDPSRTLTHDRSPVDEDTVRAAVLAISEHVNRQDFDALRADHLDSPKFTKFGPRVVRRQGFEEMIADEIAAVSSTRDLSIDFRELEVDVFGDVAIATSYPLFTSTGPNGEPVMREARMTLVYVRTSDGWKIAHEHSSPYAE